MEDPTGQTPLIMAAKQGHTQIVKLLLQDKRVEKDKEDDKAGETLSYNIYRSNVCLFVCMLVCMSLSPSLLLWYLSQKIQKYQMLVLRPLRVNLDS